MKIENYHRRRPNYTLIVHIAFWLLLAFAILHTATHFVPKMKQIELELTDMQDRMDVIMTDLEMMHND